MKKSLTVVALLAGAVSVYSQGSVLFNDYVQGTSGFAIHIWSPQLGAPGTELTGNSSTPFVANGAAGDLGDSPVGTQTGYTGVRIGGGGTAPTSGPTPTTDPAGYANGDNFSVELYAGAGTLSSFSSLNPIPATLGPIADGSDGANYAGLFLTGATVTLNGTGGTPSVLAGAAVTFALAAWYNNDGQITTLAAAEAAGVPCGWSPVGTESVGGAGGGAPLNLPGAGDSYTTAGGITSFSLITATPEPSTIALGVIGASAFLMRLRRKQ